MAEITRDVAHEREDVLEVVCSARSPREDDVWHPQGRVERAVDHHLTRVVEIGERARIDCDPATA